MHVYISCDNTEHVQGGERTHSEKQQSIQAISNTHMDSSAFSSHEIGVDVITQELGVSRMILVFPRDFHVSVRAGF